MKPDLLKLQIEVLLTGFDTICETQKTIYEEVERMRDLVRFYMAADQMASAGRAAEELYDAVASQSLLTRMASQTEQLLAGTYLSINSFNTHFPDAATQAIGGNLSSPYHA